MIATASALAGRVFSVHGKLYVASARSNSGNNIVLRPAGHDGPIIQPQSVECASHVDPAIIVVDGVSTGIEEVRFVPHTNRTRTKILVQVIIRRDNVFLPDLEQTDKDYRMEGSALLSSSGTQEQVVQWLKTVSANVECRTSSQDTAAVKYAIKALAQTPNKLWAQGQFNVIPGLLDVGLYCLD